MLDRRILFKGIAATAAAMTLPTWSTFAQEDTALCNNIDASNCKPLMLRGVGDDENGHDFSVVYIEAVMLDTLVETFLGDEFVNGWATRTAPLVYELGWYEQTEAYGPASDYEAAQVLPQGNFRVFEGISAQDINTDFADGPKMLYTYFIDAGVWGYTITVCFEKEDTIKLIELLSSGESTIDTVAMELDSYKVNDPNEYPQLWKVDS